MPPVVSTMGEVVTWRHTIPMPPVAGPWSGDGASPECQEVQTLRVADVVMTILKARKAMPAATAAAVSRTRDGDGYRVLVSLLEGSPSADPAAPQDPRDGADTTAGVFVARELGKDLADAFGDKDVFILQ
jgi:hypothetical protein